MKMELKLFVFLLIYYKSIFFIHIPLKDMLVDSILDLSSAYCFTVKNHFIDIFTTKKKFLPIFEGVNLPLYDHQRLTCLPLMFCLVTSTYISLIFTMTYNNGIMLHVLNIFNIV